MNARTVITLVVALACGLVAMYGVGQVMSKKNKPVEMRDVVLAARDLKVEEVLGPAALRVVKRPASTVPAGSFSSVEELKGRWVQITMLKDEPILVAKLAPKDLPPGLIGRIPKGKRAFAIEVNEQSGVSGFVMPDHRVDVVLNLGRDRAGGGGEKTGARTILQNMLVLAVGQVFTRPEDKSLLARTVTLVVTPEEAEILTSARARGSLALTLRGLDDTEIVPPSKPEVPPVESEAPPPVVAQAPAAPPAPEPVREVKPPPPPTHRQVVFIHGVQRVHTIKVPEAAPAAAAKADAARFANADSTSAADRGPASGAPRAYVAATSTGDNPPGH